MIEMSTRDRAIIAEAVFGLRAVYDESQHDSFVRPVKALSSDWPAGKFGEADEYKGGNPVTLGNLMFCLDVLNDALPKLDAQSDPMWWLDKLSAQEDVPGLPATMQPSFMANTLADARRAFAASVVSAIAVVNSAILMITGREG
jgi:hypothetical protein